LCTKSLANAKVSARQQRVNEIP